jgi:hypothetical protein
MSITQRVLAFSMSNEFSIIIITDIILIPDATTVDSTASSVPHDNQIRVRLIDNIFNQHSFCLGRTHTHPPTCAEIVPPLI